MSWDSRPSSFIAVVYALARQIMDIRAHTPAGVLLKLRVGEAWSTDDDWEQEDEDLIRASIKSDVEALAGG